MAVMTIAEYEKQKSSKNIERVPVKKAPTSTKKTVKKEVVEEKNIIYCLLHPENPKDSFLNFEDTISIEGVDYKRACINGVIETDEKALADFLVKKRSYEFLGTKEKDHGNNK